MSVIYAALLALASTNSTNALAGEWIFDLSTDPAKPYTKSMTLDLRADGTITGSFYDSDIQAGRWKTDRGRACASFRTTEGVGPYHTSVCARAGRVPKARPGPSIATSCSTGTHRGLRPRSSLRSALSRNPSIDFLL